MIFAERPRLIMRPSLPFILIFLLTLLPSCAGTGQPVNKPLIGELDERPGARQQDVIDTDCSYFYFLWAKTSEAAGQYDEALEAYEKAVVCDEEADYVVRHLAQLLLRMDRKQQALVWVEKLIAANPDDAKVQIFQADLHAAIGEYERAVSLYTEILADDPENSELLIKLGKLHLSTMDYAQARIIFERLVKAEPHSFPGYYYLAKLYKELRFFRKAFEAYQKALELNWSPQLAIETAVLYEEQELFADAIGIYEKMLADDQEIETAGGQLVRIYLKQNEPERALAVLQELRRNTMDSKRVDFTMGRILLEQKRYQEAIDLFEGVLAREPELEVARSILALAYYESGQAELAKEVLLRINRGDKGYDEALFMLVKIYSEEGDYDTAVRLIRQEIDEAEDDKLQYYSVLAALHEEQQDLEAAEFVLKEAMVVFPESTEAYFKYGMFLERSGRMDDAMAVMQKVLELNPKEPYALNYIGYTWADRGVNFALALEYIKEALTLRPEDGFIRDSLGWIYFKLGDFEQAVVELEKARGAEPEDPTILEHLGDAYSSLKKKAKALEYYEQSLALQEKDAEKERLRQKIEALQN